jgi:cell division protein FtsB
MTEEQELAHLTAPSTDPKQQMIDYWGHRAEKAEAEVERLKTELQTCRNTARLNLKVAEDRGAEIESLRAHKKVLEEEVERLHKTYATEIARALDVELLAMLKRAVDWLEWGPRPESLTALIKDCKAAIAKVEEK